MKDLKASVPGCKCGGAATARAGATNNTHIREERRMEKEETGKVAHNGTQLGGGSQMKSI